MSSAHDVLTRWPQLDVTGKRARLQESLRLTPVRSAMSSARPWPLPNVRPVRSGSANRRRGVTPRPCKKKIAARLGWMSSPMLMADSIERLLGFAASVNENAFTDVVLLGMGGSSLAPEVLRATLGVAPGYPRFQVLDSTDPAAVRAAATPPGTTLYLVSSKSGTTIEPNSLAAHFRERLVSEVSDTSDTGGWANHFVAITDEGTELAERARTERFRDVFINPSDIGGRYSALSFFGMVPAALMGSTSPRSSGWGLAMLAAAEPGFGTALTNPATALGLAMGAGARAGRDKLTLQLPHRLEAFGLWVEQLIAESTGKNGTGVVPIAGEHPSTRRRTAAIAVRPRQRTKGCGGEFAKRRPADAGARGDRRGIRALGSRDGRRRSAARHQPVRRAERAASEGRDQDVARAVSTDGQTPAPRPLHHRSTAGSRSRRPTWRASTSGRRARMAFSRCCGRAITLASSPISVRIRLLKKPCRRCATRLSTRRAPRRCSATGRGICTRLVSCTRAVPTPASSH
jgi:glucose-6-phosphate isomerase